MTEVEKSIAARFPIEVVEQLDKYCVQHGTNKSDVLRKLVYDLLASEQAQPEPVDEAAIGEELENERKLAAARARNRISAQMSSMEQTVQNLLTMIPYLSVHDTTDRIDNNAQFCKIALEELYRIKHPHSLKTVTAEFEKEKMRYEQEILDRSRRNKDE